MNTWTSQNLLKYYSHYLVLIVPDGLKHHHWFYWLLKNYHKFVTEAV